MEELRRMARSADLWTRKPFALLKDILRLDSILSRLIVVTESKLLAVPFRSPLLCTPTEEARRRCSKKCKPCARH